MNGNNLQGKKFAASYSGGKDSVLAIYRAIQAKLSPLELITTYNTDADRSWFHGLTDNIIRRVSDSLAIPVRPVKTSGEKYEENFEKALADAKNRGAEVCVFGDIDIGGHIEWCSARCENTGLIPYFPLANEKRKAVVHDFLDSGFSAIITIVNTDKLSGDFLGQVLTKKIAESIEKSGADICGENGEYHSFVFDGPIFGNRIEFSAGEKFERDNYRILKID
jgi:uncharacterized protein (TIGR00290 family)